MKHRLVITDLLGPDIVEESEDWPLLYRIARDYLGARLWSIEPIGESG